MSKLIVTAFNPSDEVVLEANGLIRVSSNNDEYGSIMVVQKQFKIGGFMNRRINIGFITAKVEELHDMIETNGLKEGTDLSSTDLGEHKIVTIEKLESKLTEEEIKSFRAKINPETEEELVKDGEQIYWKTEVVEANSEKVNIYIQHDKSDVVKEEVSAVTQEEEISS